MKASDDRQTDYTTIVEDSYEEKLLLMEVDERIFGAGK